MPKLNHHNLRWLILSVVVIVIDQASKFIIQKNVALYDVISLLPFLEITHVLNKGAAFSMLSNAGGWQAWFLGGLAAAVSLGIIIWLAKSPRTHAWQGAALAFILGGAVGNLIDRIRFGYVVDFIQLHWQHAWYFAAFNIADSSITIGAVMLIIDAVFKSKRGS